MKQNCIPQLVTDQNDTSLNRWLFYLLIFAATYISISFAFNMMIVKPQMAGRIIIHESIINKTAPHPIQYRILPYYLSEGLMRLTGISLRRVDLIIQFIFTYFSMVLLFRYLRKWFSFSVSALGVTFFLSVLPVTYMDYTSQSHDFPNLFFTILALMLIRDRREFWLILLIPVAMLNRESFIIVLWVWFCYNYDKLGFKMLFLEFVLFSIVAIATYLGLVNYFGARPGYVEALQINTNLDIKMIAQWLPRLLCFAGPLIVLSFLNFKSKPVFMRRSIVYLIIFMVVNFVFGIYRETRLFLPIIPVILPMGLAAIFPAHDADTNGRESQ